MADIKRIRLLGVPIDILTNTSESIEDAIMSLSKKSGTKQIVFLSIWDLLRARNKKSVFHVAIEKADLILPVSKSILRGAKFLKLDVPVRYNPFAAVIQILTALDANYRTLYLLGGHKRTLQQAEKNLHTTFRGLQIVGRYVGYYPKATEKDIVEAIFKASPTLVLLSEGVKEKVCWCYNRRNSFSSSIFLYYKDALGIFSRRIKHISDKTFDRGLEIYVELLHNPLKIFLIFPYILYKLLLFKQKFFGKK